jgi:hypothetical protein
MRKDGKDLILSVSLIFLIVAIAIYLNLLPTTITISKVTIFLYRLAPFLIVIAVGGIIYYKWGR